VYREYKDSESYIKGQSSSTKSRRVVDHGTAYVGGSNIFFFHASVLYHACIGEKCMDLRGGSTATRLLDLDSGPSGSDTTGIIRPCSTLSFPHLTSLESSFLYPADQFYFSSRCHLKTRTGRTKNGRENHETTYNLAKSG
jgi:hypothetical protein